MNPISNKSLRRRIMYRVYLSFAISLAEHRFFWQGFLFGGALALFGRLVHVSSVTNNVLATPVRELPTYVIQTFAQAASSGEFVTILSTIILLTIGVSFARAFIHLTVEDRQAHHA